MMVFNQTLDPQELSFLHLKVCRTWKAKVSREEIFQKRMHTLESELINKQRQTHKHSKIILFHLDLKYSFGTIINIKLVFLVLHVCS